MNSDAKKNVPKYILGSIITVGFFILLGLLIFRPIPQGNNEILYLAVGALISAFSLVVGYYFGSSAGSAEKTDLLKRDSSNINTK